ncbi:glycosyltransferase [Roseinatronobacter sp.]|uniref:glycosyltransferase n=1 Tax=Roseinatronobacter sp. TaxID=1945755 RepID=UPI0025EDBFEF|nr:glycosyltransferase [Roseibaca sp.]
MTAPTIAFVCASNNPQILNDNLMRSPAIASGAYPLEVVENAPSAAQAYNTGLDRSAADVVVFLHHDVYLPLGWDALLRQRIAEVEAKDPNWALLGAFGIAMDTRGYGPVWSSSINFIAGLMPLSPVPVQSFDELLIVMRRGAGLRFDEALTGWHMYGTDIVCQARAKGLGAFSVALPLIHNDGYKETLDGNFEAAFRHMARKWRNLLPIKTPVVKITTDARDLYKWRWNLWRSRKARRALAAPDARDPRDYARACGWMDLRPSLDSYAADRVNDRNTS